MASHWWRTTTLGKLVHSINPRAFLFGQLYISSFFLCPVDPTFSKHGCGSCNILSDPHVLHYLLTCWIDLLQSLVCVCAKAHPFGVLLATWPWLDFLTTDLLSLLWNTDSRRVIFSFHPCSGPSIPMQDWLRMRTHDVPYSQAHFADQNSDLEGVLKSLE